MPVHVQAELTEARQQQEQLVALLAEHESKHEHLDTARGKAEMQVLFAPCRIAWRANGVTLCVMLDMHCKPFSCCSLQHRSSATKNVLTSWLVS